MNCRCGLVRLWFAALQFLLRAEEVEEVAAGDQLITSDGDWESTESAAAAATAAAAALRPTGEHQQ